MIPIARPMIGDEEKEAVLRVLDSGQLAQGSVVAEFEAAFAEYCGVKHAIATSNGTTALHVALLANGIGPGDEVITAPFTFIASANTVLYVGAKPVFVDIDPGSFNIDPDQIEAAITPRTKAIMPIHLYGNPAEMGRIMEIAERHGLAVIEDAAQAHGTEIDGKRAGSWGTGCFSFYPTKNITTGEGGIVTTDDDCVADRARLLRAHGMRVRYYHETMGYNFRMTNIHAAIGLAQMPKLEGFNERRIANATYLSEHLPEEIVQVPQVRPGTRHIFHQYTVRVRPPLERDELRAHLTAHGVGSEVYYPVPVHQQQLYREMGYKGEGFPESERASREVLSLPIHPGLSQGDLEMIVAVVKSKA
ncbi:MAG TPA: DegT/DnrJ/EryC1/StrS family aminotransferase [Chloroflexia bacterium]|nr:DegT/DnrJ/EryC1/StrS family aminotransferase [Chloroflexia bacterium]